MTIVKRIPDEQVYYDWNDWIDLTEERNDIVILGDRRYVMFGEKLPVSIVEEDYYDEDNSPENPDECIGYDYEIIDELNKVCGGDWDYAELRGYSQGDWCRVYYNREKVPAGLLKELEIYIMGKVDEYKIIEDENNPDDAYHVLIPHDVCWDGKEAICEFLGLDPNDTKVFEDDGYTKVYKYKEI